MLMCVSSVECVVRSAALNVCLLLQHGIPSGSDIRIYAFLLLTNFDLRYIGGDEDPTPGAVGSLDRTTLHATLGAGDARIHPCIHRADMHIAAHPSPTYRTPLRLRRASRERGSA